MHSQASALLPQLRHRAGVAGGSSGEHRFLQGMELPRADDLKSKEKAGHNLANYPLPVRGWIKLWKQTNATTSGEVTVEFLEHQTVLEARRANCVLRNPEL